MPPITLPTHWHRRGLVIPRAGTGGDCDVVGDPCIVWDAEIDGWRMFLFAAPPGHGQATSRDGEAWSAVTPLVFANPGALLGGGTHKPWVVMDPYRPNHAARVDGRYALLTVSYGDRHKVIQRAWAERLAGPWTLEVGALIDVGAPDAFDARHVDAVTGYFFPERDAFLYFYMGYPERPQPYPVSPFGSAQGAAVQPRGGVAEKLGVVLPPAATPGHWAAGWVGGLQLLPGIDTPWVAVLNASPTAPNPADTTIAREEPAPSLGGYAYCDAVWPVTAWRWAADPMEWIADLPADALTAGEGTNFWRHHILQRPDGTLALYYNSGYYGQEQLYLKVGEEEEERNPGA